jgi:hypothetical protein
MPWRSPHGKDGKTDLFAMGLGGRCIGRKDHNALIEKDQFAPERLLFFATLVTAFTFGTLTNCS